MKKSLQVVRMIVVGVALCASLFSAACAGKPATPATKVSLTPEEKFALAKIAAVGAASGLEIRIANLGRDEAANADKIRILRAAKGILDEFNAQVANVTVINLSNREQVRKAIDKALAAADSLAAKDVLELNDPAIQADIKAAVEIAKSAVKSFDAFFPEQKPAQ